VKHPQADEIIDGRFGGPRLPPLLLHHLGLFLCLSLGHPLPLSPLCFGSAGGQRLCRS
jgi:hypothetical protein